MSDTTKERKPNIYLAGKISKHDWRHEIFGDDRFAGLMDPGLDANSPLFDPAYRLAFPTFNICGPFFVSCDHGCAHALNMHGADIPCCIGEEAEIKKREARQLRISDINRIRIRQADLVFTYISSPDCYGTLIELGYATALGKHIVLAFSDKLPWDVIDDFWMAQLCATAPIVRTTPKAAWDAFINGQLNKWPRQGRGPYRIYPTPVSPPSAPPAPVVCQGTHCNPAKRDAAE